MELLLPKPTPPAACVEARPTPLPFPSPATFSLLFNKRGEVTERQPVPATLLTWMGSPTGVLVHDSEDD